MNRPPILRTASVVFGLLGLLLITTHPAIAADWPQWGGRDERNMTSQEAGLPATFDPGKRRRDRLGFDPSTTKNVRWVARLGSENYSSPTIADGRVYIGTNDESMADPRFEPTRGGVLMCLDEKSGNELWKLVIPRTDIDRALVSSDFDDMNLGVCSTATVDGDRVYLVSNRCEVLCLDAQGLADGNEGPFLEEATFSVDAGKPAVKLGPEDADILWRIDMIRALPTFPHDAANSSVLVHGDYLYVGTANGVSNQKIVLPTAPSLIAINKWTGEVVARDGGQISAGVFHGQWSSPAVLRLADRDLIVFGGGDGICYAFEPVEDESASPAILKEVWRFDANPSGYRSRGGRSIDYWAVVDAKPEHLTTDGLITSPSEIIGSPVIANGRVYVAIGQDPVHGHGRGAVSCIDPNGHGDITSTGKVWQYEDIGRSLSTVSVVNGLLYVSEHLGSVHCLDAETGQPYWVHDTAEEIWSSTFVADGKVYVGTRKGLTVLATGREKKVLGQVRLPSAVWSVPTAANGTLFVANQKNLWAVTEEHEMP